MRDSRKPTKWTWNKKMLGNTVLDTYEPSPLHTLI